MVTPHSARSHSVGWGRSKSHYRSRSGPGGRLCFRNMSGLDFDKTAQGPRRSRLCPGCRLLRFRNMSGFVLDRTCRSRLGPCCILCSRNRSGFGFDRSPQGPCRSRFGLQRNLCFRNMSCFGLHRSSESLSSTFGCCRRPASKSARLLAWIQPYPRWRPRVLRRAA
jgi:hypothetical protein